MALAASWHLSRRSLSPEACSQDPQFCQHQGAPQNEGAACPATGQEAACGQRRSRHAGSTQPSLLSPHCAQSSTSGEEHTSHGQPGCRDEVTPLPGRKPLGPGSEEAQTRAPLQGSGTTSLTDHRGSGHSSQPLGGHPRAPLLRAPAPTAPSPLAEPRGASLVPGARGPSPPLDADAKAGRR